MAEERGQKKRVAPYLEEDLFRKLKKLSIACDVKPTDLTIDILSYALNHLDYVNYLQSKYKVPKDSPYRVTPIKDGDKIIY